MRAALRAAPFAAPSAPSRARVHCRGRPHAYRRSQSAGLVTGVRSARGVGSWCPHDVGRLVTASSKGGVFIWDVDNVVMAHRVQVGDAPIYCVDWGLAGCIACASALHVAVLSDAGEVLLQVRQPQHCFCVHWHAVDPSVLAFSCTDSIVRVWHLKMVSASHPSASHPPPREPDSTTLDSTRVELTRFD
jgi:WD40 repeat protein